MVAQPISELTQFSPQTRMLVPVVDPGAGVGLKNGYVTIGALMALANAGEPTTGLFIENAQTISADLVFGQNINALSVGPLKILDSVTVVLPDSSSWKVT